MIAKSEELKLKRAALMERQLSAEQKSAAEALYAGMVASEEQVSARVLDMRSGKSESSFGKNRNSNSKKS